MRKNNGFSENNKDYRGCFKRKSRDYKQKYSAQQQVIKDNYTIFEVPYNGTDNNDYVDGQGFCCDDGSPEAAQARALALENNFQDPDAYEKLQFYYHPDHLGSSSYITNLDGEVVQHIEYVPFGEVFIEERNSIWNTPYLFNAKEFDEETGLYYYGARYYDPRLSVWLSVDPLAEKDIATSAYAFCGNNPIIRIDSDGKIWETVWDIGNVLYDVGAAIYNHATGNHEAAKSNWIDAGVDAAAVVIPFIPAGATKVAKAGKAGAAGVKAMDKAADTRKAATMTENVSRKGAFNKAKRDAGIPKSQQPEIVNGKQYKMVPMKDRNGKAILGKDGKPIMTRQYHFDKPNNNASVIIQDHSSGHPQYGGEASKPHFNVRPSENPRNGTYPGTQKHYTFKK